MKIILATPLYPPQIGGPATYAKLLAGHFSGDQLTIVKFSDVRNKPKVLRHVAYFWRVYRAARQADIVFALDPVSVGLPALWAAKLARKKFLVRIAGDYAWEQGRQRFGVTEELDEFVRTQQKSFYVKLFQRVQSRVARRATRIIVPSQYFKGIVSIWKGVQAEKIDVIYSSVELPSAIEEPLNRPEGFLVVSSGRNVPWKNFDGIERVVSPEKNWHFFLATDMPRGEALGWVKAADVFVLNSTYEGLSHALVEAMLLGTPIVATNVGGNPELVEHEVTGLLVPPNDDEALHQALKTIEADPAGAARRAAAALVRAKEKFSGVHSIKKLQTILKTL